MSALLTREVEVREETRRFFHRHRRNLADVFAANLHLSRFRAAVALRRTSLQTE